MNPAPAREHGDQAALDPDLARKSRQRVFDWVATDRIRVAGAHIDLPSYGYVTRRGAGYAFEADG